MPELDQLNRQALPQEALHIITAAPMPGLDASPLAASTAQAVEDWLGSPTGQPLRDSELAMGLWLLAGHLERSHAISQHDESASGSFWHGIMHRREGDFSNAKYWFRRAAKHPIFDAMAELLSARRREFDRLDLQLDDLCQPGTYANALVDAVQASTQFAAKGPPAEDRTEEGLRVICWWEWQLLIQHDLSA